MWKTLMYHNIMYNQFEVSDDGQLRNVRTGTVYKQTILKQGYYSVCVSLGGRGKNLLVKIHRAVAETFIPNPENKLQVNHKDGNKLNNEVDNLEWVTNAENSQHAYDNGLRFALKGYNNPSSKLTYDDVEYIRKNYVPHDEEFGARPLSKKFNIHHTNISRIARYATYNMQV